VRFKVDENLPVEVAELLRGAGYDADTVADEGVGGAVDPDIATLIRREGRALLTLDIGFANIRSYPPKEYQGLVVLRLGRQDKGHVLQVCARLLYGSSKTTASGSALERNRTSHRTRGCS
jgi:predicted nuclease of predicted toxin-antitoxin system